MVNLKQLEKKLQQKAFPKETILIDHRKDLIKAQMKGDPEPSKILLKMIFRRDLEKALRRKR